MSSISSAGIRSGRYELIRTAIGRVFVQDTPDTARVQWRSVRRPAAHQVPQALRIDGRDLERRAGLHDLPTRALGADLQQNPLERLNAEIKRRTNMVGILAQHSVHGFHRRWQLRLAVGLQQGYLDGPTKRIER